MGWNRRRLRGPFKLRSRWPCLRPFKVFTSLTELTTERGRRPIIRVSDLLFLATSRGLKKEATLRKPIRDGGSYLLPYFSRFSGLVWAWTAAKGQQAAKFCELRRLAS